MRGMVRIGMVALLLAILAVPAAAQDRLGVVASFSILGDMAARIGGDHVSVRTLVGPDRDAYAYQPTSTDVQVLGDADLLLINGLGYEIWIRQLSIAAGYHGPVVAASNGIAAIRIAAAATHAADQDHGAFDPHAWHDLAQAETYVDNIVAGLSVADPGHAADYRANGRSYKTEIAALDREIRDRIAAVPAGRRLMLTAHGGFGYFSRAYGVEFATLAGITVNDKDSAADAARISNQMKTCAISALFLESTADPGPVDRIAAETGMTISGTLYSEALSPPGTPAGTFLGLVRHNADIIVAALASPPSDCCHARAH